MTTGRQGETTGATARPRADGAGRRVRADSTTASAPRKTTAIQTSTAGILVGARPVGALRDRVVRLPVHHAHGAGDQRSRRPQPAVRGRAQRLTTSRHGGHAGGRRRSPVCESPRRPPRRARTANGHDRPPAAGRRPSEGDGASRAPGPVGPPGRQAPERSARGAASAGAPFSAGTSVAASAARRGGGDGASSAGGRPAPGRRAMAAGRDPERRTRPPVGASSGA